MRCFNIYSQRQLLLILLLLLLLLLESLLLLLLLKRCTVTVRTFIRLINTRVY